MNSIFNEANHQLVFSDEFLPPASKLVLRRAWGMVVESFRTHLREAKEQPSQPRFETHELEILKFAYTTFIKNIKGFSAGAPSPYAAFGAGAGVAIAVCYPTHLPLRHTWADWLRFVQAVPSNPFMPYKSLIVSMLSTPDDRPHPELTFPTALPEIEAHPQLENLQKALSRHVQDWADLRTSHALWLMKPKLDSLWSWGQEAINHPLRVQGIEAGIILGLMNADVALLNQALELYDHVAPEKSLLSEFMPEVREWVEVHHSGGAVVLKSFTPFAGNDSDKKAMLRRYVRLMDPLPPAWPKQSLDDIFDTLHLEFPWMQRATRLLRLDAQTAIRGMNKVFRFRPILLVGPPAAGKSHYARRLAELSGLPNLLLSGAGMSDDKPLNGVPRGWSSARPSLLFDFLVQNPVMNPLVVFDELDKVSPGTHNGRAWDALLPMLEPGDAKRHFDHFLMGEMDISHFSWIFLANSTQALPEPLLSRMRVVNVERPSSEHMPDVSWRMWRTIGQESGLLWHQWPELSDSEMSIIARNHGHSNLRKLYRVIEALFYMRLESRHAEDALQ